MRSTTAWAGATPPPATVSIASETSYGTEKLSESKCVSGRSTSASGSRDKTSAILRRSFRNEAICRNCSNAAKLPGSISTEFVKQAYAPEYRFNDWRRYPYDIHRDRKSGV